jgi:hypothetical protein
MDARLQGSPALTRQTPNSCYFGPRSLGPSESYSDVILRLLEIEARAR